MAENLNSAERDDKETQFGQAFKQGPLQLTNWIPGAFPMYTRIGSGFAVLSFRPAVRSMELTTAAPRDFKEGHRRGFRPYGSALNPF